MKRQGANSYDTKLELRIKRKKCHLLVKFPPIWRVLFHGLSIVEREKKIKE